MRLSQLIAALPDSSSLRGGADPEITAVVHDSRQALPGALFVAVRGGSADGHGFIPQAIEKGAVAVVVEDAPSAAAISDAPVVRVPDSREALAWLSAAWHGFPARRLAMIGVTGTDGKTTTTNLLFSILQAAGLNAGMISTINAVIGDQALDTGLHTTTPDAPDVQRYLAQMAEAGTSHCVLEATSHGLAQGRVSACEFDVAIVTNITHEHLDYHGSLEAYRAAKARLFESLSTAAVKPGLKKAAVLNLDDWSYPFLRERLKVRGITYGLSEAADVSAANTRHGPTGIQFTIVAGDVRIPVKTALVGEYNVSNCLAAAATALKALHIPPEAVRAGIASVRAVPGRMERIDLGQPFTAIVDFAHTPNALRRALEAARALTPGRVIAVFGSAGLRDREKRRLMPEVGVRLADISVLTAEDPRTESLDAILADMAGAARGAGGVEGQTFHRVPDRGEAIRFALSLARPGDVVIACGKGHEQSMCFGEVEYPWDDRTALRAALAERLGVPGPAMPRLPTSA